MDAVDVEAFRLEQARGSRKSLAAAVTADDNLFSRPNLEE